MAHQPLEDTSHLPPSNALTSEEAIQQNLDSVKHIVMGRGTFEKVVEMGEWPYSKHQVLVSSTTLMEDVTENVKVVRSMMRLVCFYLSC